MSVEVFDVAPMTPGSASGSALVLDEALSLWGGVDPATGVLIDRHHPQHGACIAEVVVFMPHGRGSSSASSVLVEMVRLGTAPAAFVLRAPDETLAIGSLVAGELYGHSVPIVAADVVDAAGVETGDTVRVDGFRLVVEKRSA